MSNSVFNSYHITFIEHLDSQLWALLPGTTISLNPDAPPSWETPYPNSSPSSSSSSSSSSSLPHVTSGTPLTPFTIPISLPHASASIPSTSIPSPTIPPALENPVSPVSVPLVAPVLDPPLPLFLLCLQSLPLSTAPNALLPNLGHSLLLSLLNSHLWLPLTPCCLFCFTLPIPLSIMFYLPSLMACLNPHSKPMMTLPGQML